MIEKIFLFLALALPVSAETLEADVCIYGATPAGIAAAVSAGKSGADVILVTPGTHIGGLLSGGLSYADYHTSESLTGFFLDFSKRVLAHYVDKYGAGSEQVKSSKRGTFGEPHVNLLVLKEMLSEQKSVTVRQDGVLTSLEIEDKRIVSAAFKTPKDGLKVRAEVFIDATYEGDFMPLAGVAYAIGREGKSAFNESLAPDEADGQLQAYNFRLSATKDAQNRVPAAKPPGYNREDFLPLLDLIAAGKLQEVFGYPPVRAIYKAQKPALPNGKFDINDISHGVVRLSMPIVNLGWPEGDQETRQAIFDEHLRYNTGMLYFLQTDAEVPPEWREKANEWGWCKDEFVTTNHLPPELYVREARRMQGEHIYIQADSEWAGEDARTSLFTDSIAMGDYGNNCHGTFREGTRFHGKHTGEFYHAVPPYQIPYGVLLPKKSECVNLLVPTAVSSSHVGFCALRLEPIWCSLGQAAGHAAALAVETKTLPHEIPVGKLQSRLHAEGSATIYFSDVLPDHPDFAAVQWWGTAGAFHGIHEKTKPRGTIKYGQYFKAAPNHAADLNAPLDGDLRERWTKLAGTLGIGDIALPENPTRGDFIRAANQSR